MTTSTALLSVLAGLINAMKVVGKDLRNAALSLLGGAAGNGYCEATSPIWRQIDYRRRQQGHH